MKKWGWNYPFQSILGILYKCHLQMIKFDQIGRSVSDANDANGQPHILLVGMIIPNIWKNKKCSKSPTRYIVIPIFQLLTIIHHRLTID